MPKVDVLDELDSSFWRRGSVRRMIAGLSALVSVITFGIIGYLMMGWSFSDALYMVVITVSGVGFSEVRPVIGLIERTHTILLITFGIVSVAYMVAGFLQFVTEGEIRKVLGHQRVRRQIETLKDHTIVAGFGRMGTLVSEELSAGGMPFVVVESSPERSADIEKLGYLYVIGDATEESVLQEAGLEHAKYLVTVVPSDSNNVFITLTARQLAPNVQIIARAEMPSTQKKLRQAGANHVVLPAAIGARRITSLVLNPYAVQFIDLMTHRSHLAIEMDEVSIEASSPLAGKTLRDADVGRKTGVVVVAIKKGDGRVDFPPTGDEPMTEGDSIVLLGSRTKLDQFCKQYGDATCDNHG